MLFKNAEDTRCDIYAFGAVLYEMLTGEPPYKGENAKEVRAQIIAAPPKPILILNPQANRGLVTVAESAMGRELRERYADMTDVLADLQRVKENKPPTGPHGIAGKMRGQLLRVGQISPVTWLFTGVAIFAVIGWLLWRNGPPKREIIQSHPSPSATNVVKTPPAIVTNPAPPVTLVSNPPAPVINTNPTVPINTPVKLPGTLTFATLAGQPGSKGSADGDGANARFDVPSAIAVDGAGNIYVADAGSQTIRKIAPDGTAITLAGVAGSSGSMDGNGGSARFLAPFGIAADSAGNVYVADTFNNTIRKIAANGTVKAPSPGSRNIPAKATVLATTRAFAIRGTWPWTTRAMFMWPTTAITPSARIAPDGATSTLAGSAGSQGSNDGTGSAARFWYPQGVAVDPAGNLYVSDSGNQMIRKITPNGMVTTLAGMAGSRGNTDGGPGYARFSNPRGLAVDGSGNILVADTDNSLIRKITPAGLVSTVAGRTDSPVRFSHPYSVAVDQSGNIYVADTDNHVIRKGSP